MRGLALLLVWACLLSSVEFSIEVKNDKFDGSKMVGSYFNLFSSAKKGTDEKRDAYDDFFGAYINFAQAIKADNSTETAIMFSDFTNGTEAETKRIYNPIKEIIFLADGEKISVKLWRYDYDHDLGSIQCSNGRCTSSTTEHATGLITLDKIKKIANAKTLEAKVVGGSYDTIYHANQIDKNFQKNTRSLIQAIEKQRR
jgi:hypothetical protein